MNDVTMLVLTSLADGAKHGYAIQQDVQEFAGKRLGPGSLYGAIDRLERDGLIQPLPSPERRRPYDLTDLGRRFLRDRVSEMRNLVDLAEARAG